MLKRGADLNRALGDFTFDRTSFYNLFIRCYVLQFVWYDLNQSKAAPSTRTLSFYATDFRGLCNQKLWKNVEKLKRLNILYLSYHIYILKKYNKTLCITEQSECLFALSGPNLNGNIVSITYSSCA